MAILRWGDNELRFTATNTPSEYGSVFPPYPVYEASTHEAYIKSLAPYFQGNAFLDRDFIIEPVGITLFGVTIWVLKFTAREAGSQYNLAKTEFAGGGVGTLVLGTDASTVPNNSVYVEIWMQDPTETIFQKKYFATHLFDANGVAEFDVASVLHSNLASEIPDMLLPIAERCKQSRRKYFLRYALYGGQNPSVGTLQQTAEHVVLLGGFAQWKSGPQSVIETFKMSESQSRIFKLRKGVRVVRMDEPVFATWVNFGPADRTIVAMATLTFADGSQQTTNTQVISGVGQYEKLIFGVGFKQLSLDILHGQGKYVQEYTVEIRDNLGVVSDAYRMVVDYKHLEYVRYFAHVNSYGAIETLMTSGKGSSNWKVFKETAQKVMPYRFQSTEAQFVDWNNTYQDNQEVATGWLRQKDLPLWLDLFISGLKYRVINGSPYAIQIKSDTIQKGSDGDNQFGFSFEYQFARIFDAVNEELLEGEDSADIIPPNVVLAGSASSGAGGGGQLPTSGPPNFYVDPYPIKGSRNAVSSDGVNRILELFQKKIQPGSPDQYLNGELQPRNLRQSVNAVESDPTVPSYAKTLTGLEKIVEGLYQMSPGLNAMRFNGELAEWYMKRMAHPAFDRTPPVIVEKGKAFEKYLDLTKYKTSYHPNEELDVEIVLNTLKLSGVNITANELMITLKGTLTEELAENENVLLIIRDQFRNQTSVALRLQTLDQPEEPENPDNRPVCAKGPFHYEPTAIVITNNGEFVCPFDASGVDPIEWVIATTQNASGPLRTGQSPALGGPFFKATFPALPGGEYWIGIRGVLCKSNWAWRKLVLPVDTTLQFAEGYPKHVSQGSDSKFLTKMTLSGSFLTEVLNLNTNVKVYSQTHDYVADSTEIPILKTGGWPEANYRVSVGTASATVKVGNPPSAPSHVFKLVAGWDGDQIADLSAAAYDGPVPSTGFNGYFKADETGATFRFYRLKLEKEVAGNFVLVTAAGGAGVAGAPSNIVPVMRLFSSPGVDSRSVMFQGASLNTRGKLRITLALHSGVTEDSPIVKTYQQTVQFNELKVLGGWGNTVSPGARIVPSVGGVKYNGVNVVNNNVWAEPWASYPSGVPKLQFSLDKVSWYPTSAFFDGFGGATESCVLLLNTSAYSAVDLFPPGSKKTVYLRDGMNHDLISDGYVINQSGAVGGDVTPKTYAKGYWMHVKMKKEVTPTEVLFTDESTDSPQSGYIYWYIFNTEIIKTMTPLSNYPYPKGKPWGIFKAMVQVGYNGTLQPWNGEPGSNEALAASFPHGVSIAFDCGVQNKK
ncbi:hypothetical protein SAMN05216327_101192 [Dyadobacter sp. SG02]|nr:hypothetical protein SAMN05216327_101192 [Dyadobacter sp. SG02]